MLIQWGDNAQILVCCLTEDRALGLTVNMVLFNGSGSEFKNVRLEDHPRTLMRIRCVGFVPQNHHGRIKNGVFIIESSVPNDEPMAGTEP